MKMSVATTYTIVMGLYRDNTNPITEDEFNLFLTQEVCPLLKSFSVREELGFFEGEPEPCKVISYVSTEFEDGIAIHAIATHYKARFNQQAVMINSFASFPDFV
jgi:hypothetical protein